MSFPSSKPAYNSPNSHENVNVELKSAPNYLSSIRSSVSEWDVPSIRLKFYIPDDYKIIVPSKTDRIDKSPKGCLAFHIATFEAGLRFPLSRPVEDILTGLDVCPAYLVPNAYRQILGLIILMCYFQVEPSFVNFSNLVSLASHSRRGDRGFFYLTSRPKCRVLHNLPQWVGHWKDKFIYVEPPRNTAWRVPTIWNVNRLQPRDLGSPSWNPDFISRQLTVTMYDVFKLITEEVLALAGLSPAPIKTTRSLGMAVEASAMWEQKDVPLLVQSRSSDPEIPPRRRSKRKEEVRDGSSRHGRDEKGSGEEVSTAKGVRKTEKIVEDMHGDSSKIGSRTFKQSAGKNALEMEHYTLTQLKDIADHHSSRTNDVTHHLYLRAANLENEVQSCKTKLNEANEKLENQAIKFRQKVEELEKSLNDSKLKIMELRHQREESFNAGRAAGRQEFIESDEYRSATKTLKDLMKSFENIRDSRGQRGN